MLAAALALGGAIGIVMGALGGGGSILTVPVLVFVLGLSAQEATTASLVIVGITAAVAAVGHARSRATRWRTGLTLAAVGVPASVLGSVLNRAVDENVLLLAFAALMLVAAAGMLARTQHPDLPVPGAGGPVATGAGPGTAAAPRGRLSLRLVSAGLVIGFLTGFLGVGGGFVIVPVLVLALGLPMPAAVGTSLLVIALNSAVALAARAGSGHIAWEVIVPFTLAAVTGALVGKRVAQRLPDATLTRSFAALLLLVAAYVAVRAGQALA